MKRRPSKARTAAELVADLKRNPEYVREAQARKQEAQALEQRLRGEEQALVRELADVGVIVDSVWDLVNTRSNYASAIPVLVRHLSIPYHPRTREGIARALTIRNLPLEVGKAIVQELRSSLRDDEQELRWSLANALSCVADPSIGNEIEALRADSRLASLRAILDTALRSVRERRKQR